MKLDSRVSWDSRFSIDWTCWFLSDIDPYKAVDNMWKRYLTFGNKKTQEECERLLKEYLKNHLDLSEITKWQNE
jgi:hypothetical protein